MTEKLQEIINQLGYWTKDEEINEEYSYRASCRGYITASKLKSFIANPYLYKIMWINESIPEDEDSCKHFKKGTAFHALLELGIDGFFKKYEISDGYLKADLQAKLIDLGFDKKTVMKAGNMPILREMYYGTEKRLKMESKRQLTHSEGRDILGAYLSVQKQRGRHIDYKGYNLEKRIQNTFSGMIIGLKPDRFIIYRNNDIKDFIMREDYQALVFGLNHTQKQEYAKRNNIKILLRDYKTSANIETLKKSIFYEDDKYGYLLSMAFYYVVVFLETGVKAQVVLDIVETAKPYYCEILSISQEMLDYNLSEIEKYLFQLKECIETDNRPKPTRDDKDKSYVKKYRNYFDVQQPRPTYLEGNLSI